MLKLNQLCVFHAVATLKSFTHAADAVHLTQPGISKHIKELEEYYGVRLFERRARSLSVNSSGRNTAGSDAADHGVLRKGRETAQKSSVRPQADWLSPPHSRLASTFCQAA
jgi:hypothetical protein